MERTRQHGRMLTLLSELRSQTKSNLSSDYRSIRMHKQRVRFLLASSSYFLIQYVFQYFTDVKIRRTGHNNQVCTDTRLHFEPRFPLWLIFIVGSGFPGVSPIETSQAEAEHSRPVFTGFAWLLFRFVLICTTSLE